MRQNHIPSSIVTLHLPPSDGFRLSVAVRLTCKNPFFASLLWTIFSAVPVHVRRFFYCIQVGILHSFSCLLLTSHFSFSIVITSGFLHHILATKKLFSPSWQWVTLRLCSVFALLLDFFLIPLINARLKLFLDKLCDLSCFGYTTLSSDFLSFWFCYRLLVFRPPSWQLFSDSSFSSATDLTCTEYSATTTGLLWPVNSSRISLISVWVFCISSILAEFLSIL